MSPLDKEVVYRRLNRLEGIFLTLEKNAQVSLEDYLKDEDLQAAVEQRLRLAAQICIDIANYLLARLRLELPEEEENLFLSLLRIILKTNSFSFPKIAFQFFCGGLD
ncbi:MAG: HepT-like ribonuclease domain-containing protein [candidate division WOR-3 bacterium]